MTQSISVLKDHTQIIDFVIEVIQFLNCVFSLTIKRKREKILEFVFSTTPLQNTNANPQISVKNLFEFDWCVWTKTMSKMSKNKLNLTLPPGSVDAAPIVPTPPFKTPSGTE